MSIKKLYTNVDGSSLVILFDDKDEISINRSLIAGEIKEKDIKGIKTIERVIDKSTPKSIKNLPQVLQGVFLRIQDNKYELRVDNGARKLISKEEAKTLRSIIMGEIK